MRPKSSPRQRDQSFQTNRSYDKVLVTCIDSHDLSLEDSDSGRLWWGLGTCIFKKSARGFYHQIWKRCSIAPSKMQATEHILSGGMNEWKKAK